jgi:protease-4
VAQPTSVVGSIGVIFQTINLTGTMAKLGIRAEAIKSGSLKDMGSPLHDLTDAERQVMQTLVDEYFDRFAAQVRSARRLDIDRLEAVTDGRIFSGTQARQLGLVDKLGTLEDAIVAARQRAGLSASRAVLYRRPYGPSGSVYASAPGRPDRPQLPLIDLPEPLTLPAGFYFLWRP